MSRIFCSTRLQALVALTCSSLGCASIHDRLPSGVASAVTATVVRSSAEERVTMPVVRTHHATHGDSAGAGALLGIVGVAIVEANRAEMYGGRPAPPPEKSVQELTRLLQEQTADVSLRDQYEFALQRTLSQVGWLKLHHVERDAVGLAGIDKLSAQGRSLLRVVTTQRISEDGRLLLVESMLGFCPAGSSAEPSARVQIRYRSEEIGAEGPTQAVALWAKNHGQAYRKAIGESVSENMKMTTMALQHMAGTHYGGRAELLKAHLASESADAEGEQPATEITATIVEESNHRLIIQAEWLGTMWFVSLPKSAIEARFYKGATPGTAWQTPPAPASRANAVGDAHRGELLLEKER